jgi:uncharacterized protein (UPF0276 family)
MGVLNIFNIIRRSNMSENDIINTSKMMTVEYYNRYIQNMEPDMSDVLIDINNVKVIEKNDRIDSMHLILQVDVDLWLSYNVIYNKYLSMFTESYITLN